MQASVEIVKYREGRVASRRSSEGWTFLEGFGVRASFDALPEGTLKIRAEAKEAVSELGVDLLLVWPEWTDGYVLVPGAAYDGNRFRVLDRPYPPIYDGEEVEETEPTITDLPRLPALHLLAGDGSLPAVGLWDRERGTAHLVLFPAETNLGPVGLRVEESASGVSVRVQFPGVRYDGRYAMGHPDAPSADRGASVGVGWSMESHVVVESVPATSAADLFEALDRRRNRIVPPELRREIRPFSSVAGLVALDMAERLWRSEEGFFATLDQDEGIDFQIGWVGGGMGTLALVESGDPELAARARRNIDFECATMQAPSGFFYGGYRNGVCGDGFGHPHAERWGMVRKSGDTLLFMVRHILCETDPPSAWRLAARRCAEGFVQTWEKHGQWGQFVDVQDGRVVVGGSACGGTAIAGLALASRSFREERFLTVATAAAERYATDALRKGVLNGGPGEILKAPDSESAFGLLEGYVVLWETTGEARWLDLARETALQAASWVVPYDFPFPADSTFGRMGMRSSGTVIANVQNKHGAPGICTASALPLLKLFRATGERRWLDLAVDISHALPQYVSTAERPIRADDGRDLKPGWINERVNLSDWEAPGRGPGEVFYGSCWCAASVLLTALEMPGIYVQPSRGLVACADHVTARLDGGTLTAMNPTDFSADLRILVDEDPGAPLGELWWRRAPRLALAPGETVSLPLHSTVVRGVER